MLSPARRLVSHLTLLWGAVAAAQSPAQPAAAAQGSHVEGASRPAQGADPQPTLALEVGTIHPISGPAIQDGVIVLAGTRILSVGAKASVPIPAGVPVQTFAGAHAYPGLIDAHSQACLAEGGVAEVDAGTSARAALDPASNDGAASLAAGITTAHVVVAGAGRWLGTGVLMQPRTTGFAVFAPMCDGALHMRLTAAPGQHPVARLKDLADLGRPFEEATAYRKSQAKHKEALAQYDKDWAAYLEARKAKPTAKPPEAAGEAGDAKPADAKPEAAKPDAKRPTFPRAPGIEPAKDALARVVDGSLRLRIEAERRDEIRAALRTVRELNLGGATLLGASDGAALADEIAAAGVGVILTPTGLRAELDGEPVSDALAAELHKRGVPIAIASGDAARARWLPLLAASCVGAGLSADAALRALTLTPAELLGIAAEVGSLEPGKRADILLTSAPLLQSDARVLRVFVGGKTVHQGR